MRSGLISPQFVPNLYCVGFSLRNASTSTWQQFYRILSLFTPSYDALAKYMKRTMNGHKRWAYRFFFCELLNLGVVVATLFFTDWFLGGEFLKYGTNVSPASSCTITCSSSSSY